MYAAVISNKKLNPPAIHHTHFCLDLESAKRWCEANIGKDLLAEVFLLDATNRLSFGTKQPAIAWNDDVDV